MVRRAILSDVHGNIEALEAVINHAKEQKVEEYIFLGDYVGYGPNPIECIEFIQELGKKEKVRCIAGNHDHNVIAKASGVGTENLNGSAKAIKSWAYTINQLYGGREIRGKTDDKINKLVWDEVANKYPAEIDALKEKINKFNERVLLVFSRQGISLSEIVLFESNLNFVNEFSSIRKAIESGKNALKFLEEIKEQTEIIDGNAHYVHACHLPGEHTEHYVLTEEEAKNLNVRHRTPRELCENYKEAAKFLFGGHSHCETIPIQRRVINGHVYINVGSVGYSRKEQKGEPQAVYTIFEDEKIKLCKVNYDWRKTRQKCLNAGLEDIFS